MSAEFCVFNLAVLSVALSLRLLRGLPQTSGDSISFSYFLISSTASAWAVKF
jgi:hypothetical protein